MKSPHKVSASLPLLSALATAALSLVLATTHAALPVSSKHNVGAQTPVTYAHDVAPILNAQCVTCHRTGEVAPFTLTGYAQAKAHADMIAVVTQSRVMPPWHAAPGYGNFDHARLLTAAQIGTLKNWAAENAPEGNPAALPPAPSFPAGAWSMGRKPDLILTMPEAYKIPADGNDIYQCFVLPSGIADDRFVSAIEIRPGNPKVVHHCIVYLDNRHVASAKLDASDPGAGYRSFGGPGFLPTGVLGGWAPGAAPHDWPRGVADYMAGGSDVVLQMHYHPSGKPETDRSQLGIYFSKAPVTAVTSGIPLWNSRIDIPAGDSNYKLTADFTLPVACKAIGIIPHMHLLGRQMKVDAYLPDGTVKPMIYVKDWNFNWQDQYRYKTPVDLPAGTRLVMTARYDNSSDNPYNPNVPPKEVKFGEQTTDEMSLCFVQVVTDDPGQRQMLVRGVLRHFIRSRSAIGEAL